MNNKSIGIFDSGLGGLCALIELQKLLPNEHFIYFGDTGRTPYGTRSAEKIREYAASDIRFLRSKNVKTVLIACGTVSSVVLPDMEQDGTLPIYGIIIPSAKEAASLTKNKTVGIMATGATVGTGLFDKLLRESDPEIKTVSVSCPLLIPIVENGFADTKISELTIEQYIAPIIESGADTLILGCTHFPILAKQIAKMYPHLTLVNSAAASARHLCEVLREKDMLADGSHRGTEYFVSDRPNNFTLVAKSFLGHENLNVEKIEIE